MTAQSNLAPGISHIIGCLPEEPAQALSRLPCGSWEKIEELRFLAQRPVMVYRQTEGQFLTPSGSLTSSIQGAITITGGQVISLFRRLCENSVYAKEEDIRQGFLSLPGGHRAGICGSAVLQRGDITFLKNISAVNIRIAHQAIGCADDVIRHICSGGRLHNTLVVSPPGAGKTTLLRDIARTLGGSYKVGIADERGEIAAVYKGVPQNDIGLRSVVMDSCPKALAIGLMIRSMGIECVITDEIGSAADARAVELASCAGVQTIASVHGAELDDLRAHPHLSALLPLFDYIILLQKPTSGPRIKQIIHTKER